MGLIGRRHMQELRLDKISNKQIHKFKEFDKEDETVIVIQYIWY
jgi:hypothetical protein